MQYSDHSIYVHGYWSSNPRTLGRMSHGGGDVETKKWQYGVKSILPKINLKTESKNDGCQKITK